MTPEPAPSLPWGWPRPVRWLLIALAVGPAIALWGHSVVQESAPLNCPPAPVFLLDPNQAPAPVLAALPGLGPARVAAIVAARNEAPLRSLDDLEVRVRGIGPVTAAALAPYLCFPPESGTESTPKTSPALAGPATP